MKVYEKQKNTRKQKKKTSNIIFIEIYSRIFYANFVVMIYIIRSLFICFLWMYKFICSFIICSNFLYLLIIIHFPSLIIDYNIYFEIPLTFFTPYLLHVSFTYLIAIFVRDWDWAPLNAGVEPWLCIAAWIPLTFSRSDGTHCLDRFQKTVCARGLHCQKSSPIILAWRSTPKAVPTIRF